MYSHGLTAAYVRKILDYNPETGDLTWRGTKSGRTSLTAGTTGEWGRNGKRRRTLTINYKIYKAHRIIWLWMTGAWPKDQIDHINRDALDNRWANLCLADPTVNASNRSMSRNNTSGVNGVFWDKSNQRWKVSLRNKFLGAFRTKEEAIALIEKLDQYGSARRERS